MRIRSVKCYIFDSAVGSASVLVFGGEEVERKEEELSAPQKSRSLTDY